MASSQKIRFFNSPPLSSASALTALYKEISPQSSSIIFCLVVSVLLKYLETY